jgi:hypothetical protein
VIASGDLDEAGSRKEPAGTLPAVPVLPDVFERHALIARAHDDDNRCGRRFAIAFNLSELLEEATMDRQVLLLGVVKEEDRIARRELLDPSPPETERWCDQHEGRGCAVAPELESDQSAERASNNHRGLVPLRFGLREPGHGVEVEASKGRDIQIRDNELEIAHPEDSSQSGDLPPAGRRGKSMEVQNLLHAKRRIDVLT